MGSYNMQLQCCCFGMFSSQVCPTDSYHYINILNVFVVFFWGGDGVVIEQQMFKFGLLCNQTNYCTLW